MKCSHQLTLCNKFRFLLMTYEVIVSKREGTGNQIIDTFPLHAANKLYEYHMATIWGSVSSFSLKN